MSNSTQLKRYAELLKCVVVARGGDVETLAADYPGTLFAESEMPEQPAARNVTALSEPLGGSLKAYAGEVVAPPVILSRDPSKP